MSGADALVSVWVEFVGVDEVPLVSVVDPSPPFAVAVVL
jgi:hypothetical protein